MIHNKSKPAANHRLIALLEPGPRLVWEYETLSGPVSADLTAIESHLARAYTADHAHGLLTLGSVDRSVRFSPSIEFWHGLCARFVSQALRDPRTESLRGKIKITLSDEEAAEILSEAPPMTGFEYLNADIIQKVWADLHGALRVAAKDSDEPISMILSSLASGHAITDHRIHFHLVENRNDDSASPFAFLATYAAKSEGGHIRHLPLENAMKEYRNDDRRLVALLSAVHRAAKKSALIQSFLEAGEIFHPLRLTEGEAYQFLCEVPEYEDAGILCRIPRWWGARPRRITSSIAVGSAAKSARLGADTLLECKAVLRIGDDEISPEEARDILSRYESLALIKNRWVVVDRESLEEQLRLFDQARVIAGKTQVTIGEAMRLVLGGSMTSAGAVKWTGDVQWGESLRTILDNLRKPEKIKASVKIRALTARLREYQKAGVGWLAFLHNIGLGGCLADDMGLGKTIQVLAFLLHLKEIKNGGSKQGPSLLVVPSSLIFNWLQEAQKFAPTLNVQVAHSSYSDNPKKAIRGNKKPDLVITTYSMAGRLNWLRKYKWFYVILDEAQAVKNPGAIQTKAVKALSSDRRLILTGTPIENRLGDLWSLFDFVQPGLLGSSQEFRRFVSSLESNPEGYAKLRQIVQPCILRRLKTDKSVIPDLPRKVEMKIYTELSRSQKVLYKRLADELIARLNAVQGIQRRGIILAYIQKFKQACNHSDQLSGAGDYAESGSGKFGRLREICEELRDRRERVLVFTQFREMIEPLDRFLFEVYGRPGVRLHGGTSLRGREKAVNTFQGSDYVPFFILSLKAGGTGLNLTAATHVVHFDRWWNPAVETQAEDRAYRIGQKKNVVVHKFICKGTLEEKIDEIIESKRQTAEKVLSASGEKWITEMSNDELREMISLRISD